jgi:hypothetical protein
MYANRLHSVNRREIRPRESANCQENCSREFWQGLKNRVGWAGYRILMCPVPLTQPPQEEGATLQEPSQSRSDLLRTD